MIVLTNARVAVVTGLLYVLAALLFYIVAGRAATASEVEVEEASAVFAGFMGALWVVTVLTLPRRRRTP